MTRISGFLHRVVGGFRRRTRTAIDAGMTTAEYAVGTVAPVGRIIRSQRPGITGLHCVLLGS